MSSKNCADRFCGGCESCLGAQGIVFDGEIPCSSCDKLQLVDELNDDGMCPGCVDELRIKEQAEKEAKEI